MSAIITSLVSLFGPMIGKLLLEWLTGILNKASKKITFDENQNEAEKARDLLQEAIKITPLRRPGKRLLLRAMSNRCEVYKAHFGGKLPKKDEDGKMLFKDEVSAAKRDL